MMRASVNKLGARSFFFLEGMKFNQPILCLLGALATHASWLSPAIAADEVVTVTNASPFAPTIPNKAPPPANAPEGHGVDSRRRVLDGLSIPSEGVCSMATMNAVMTPQPIHRVYVDGFWMDTTDVTNEEFEKFVKATGYVTIAERTPTKEEFPTAPPENLVAGSVGLHAHAEARAAERLFSVVALRATARTGVIPPDRTATSKVRRNYPVVQVAYADAVGLREVGGQATADRGGMGICRARRADRQDLCVGR